MLGTAIVQNPVFGVGLTAGTYWGAVGLHRRLGRNPLLTPVFVTIVIVAGVLELLGIDYADYLTSVQPISLLLGPATVALAVPLVVAARGLRDAAVPVLVAVVAGCLTALLTTWGVLRLFGVDKDLLLSMLTKSVTTPVALGVSAEIGGTAPLAAVFSIVTGIIGAVAGPSLLRLARIRDERARGLAVGVAAHGIGTAAILAESEKAGGWSGAGMVLSALLTTALLPVVVPLADSAGLLGR
ncbi:LrgB family protein [Nakamurella sp. YIM 132087]|uniref:LrgB family protein n=1 Tax=Nakamurella alba TaxID=2665158 RepID=A0A7K1FIX8_9ACTN|nr:LrgB family protein [Nakamurella alba]